jgi:hypothetical protein
MQSRESNDTSAQVPAAVQPPVAAEESVDHLEVSHVFHCMQCDLQFQMDMAVTSHGGSEEIDEVVIVYGWIPASSWSGKQSCPRAAIEK